jgi:hypothetical protein
VVGLYQPARPTSTSTNVRRVFGARHGGRPQAGRDVPDHPLYLERGAQNLKKRLLVIDEAWWMMKTEDTASFLYGMAKRGRKYYLGAGDDHPRRRRLLKVALRVADDHQLVDPAPAQAVADNDRQPAKNL